MLNWVVWFPSSAADAESTSIELCICKGQFETNKRKKETYIDLIHEWWLSDSNAFGYTIKWSSEVCCLFLFFFLLSFFVSFFITSNNAVCLQSSTTAVEFVASFYQFAQAKDTCRCQFNQCICIFWLFLFYVRMIRNCDWFINKCFDDGKRAKINFTATFSGAIFLFLHNSSILPILATIQWKI